MPLSCFHFLMAGTKSQFASDPHSMCMVIRTLSLFWLSLCHSNNWSHVQSEVWYGIEKKLAEIAAMLWLLYAFRDLWNFQIFSQNCQFHHRRLESLEHFNIILSTMVSFLENTILFLQVLFFFILCTFQFSQVHFFSFCVHFACVLCI